MESEHFLGGVSQRAFICENGKILIIRHPSSEHFGFPGGRLHKGEAPEIGLAREIKEELGLDITMQKPRDAGIEMYPSGPHYFVVFDATLSNSKQTITPDSQEIAEIRWVGKKDIPGLKLYPDCEKALRAYLA